MQFATKLFCFAICATMPLALNAAPLKTGSSKASSVKVTSAKVAKSAKTAKHKLKAKHGVKKTVARQDGAKAVVIQESVPKLAISPTTASVVNTDIPRPALVAAPSAPVRRVNPYLAEQYAQSAHNPYLAMEVAAPQALLADNPYLAKPNASPQPMPAAQAAPSAPWSFPPVAPLAAAPAMTVPQVAMPSAPATAAPGAAAQAAGGNPNFVSPTAPPTSGRDTGVPTTLAKLDPMQDLNRLFNSVRNGIPALNGQDLLPTIKKVYPTGEKPLVILSFKCPTEMVGVSTPPMKALHEIVNYAFDGINKTNLLSFNMQQVCQ